MRIRLSCPVTTALLTTALAITWAPTASALTPRPTSTSGSSVPQLREEKGGIGVLTKDSGGDLLAGAVFTLFNDTSQEVASGTTDAQGQVAFDDLPAGIYRLKEASSGSALHDLVADQDVVVAPGQTTSLTVIEPFKPADLTVTKTDRASNKPLPGAVITVTSTSGGTTLTVTTGTNGTATAQLPVSSRTGTPYTLTETKAPTGYQLDARQVKLTARAAAPVTATLTDNPTDQPTKPPTAPVATPPHNPSGKPVTSTKPAKTASPSASISNAPTVRNSAPGPKAPQASLAHTGSDATPWLTGSAGLLLGVGGATVLAARRRTARSRDDDPSTV